MGEEKDTPSVLQQKTEKEESKPMDEIVTENTATEETQLPQNPPTNEEDEEEKAKQQTSAISTVVKEDDIKMTDENTSNEQGEEEEFISTSAGKSPSSYETEESKQPLQDK